MKYIQAIILILATASLSGCLATAKYVNGKVDCAAAPDKVSPQQRYEFPFRLVYEEEAGNSPLLTHGPPVSSKIWPRLAVSADNSVDNPSTRKTT
jgi:hypothetical protein